MVQYVSQYSERVFFLSHFFKRTLAFILVFSVVLTPCLHTAALESIPDSSVPIVVISGDSNPILDKDGNTVFSTEDIGQMVQKICLEGEELTDAVFRLLGQFLKLYYRGAFTGNFEPYYDFIYNTVQSAFGDSLLDCNGEVTNGSHIRLKTAAPKVKKNAKSYSTKDYRFFYDWRLDPFQTADELNTYIKKVKAATGFNKVGVMCRCLGGNVFLAYVSKYGMDDVCGVAFDGVVLNGSEILSDPICGKFRFDADAINRTLIDLNAVNKANVDSAIPAAIDTVVRSGMVDLIKFIIKFPNYNRIEKGITSAIALSGFYTWPNYWAAVKAEDYEEALNFVFGCEGSEKRTTYAGLIEKLDNYDRLVRRRIPELMQQINESANMVIISKYGFQCAPITKSNALVGDQLISAQLSSFGAKTSTIYDSFSDEYVADAAVFGLDKYISPDRQIDASTCLYPEQTFFIKGSSHSDWTMPEMELMVKVICADRQLTVDDLPDEHFMVYDYETDTASPMTVENAHTENWKIDISQRSINPILKAIGFFKSAITLIKVLSADN